MNQSFELNILFLNEYQPELDFMEKVLNNAGYVSFPANNEKTFFDLLESIEADLILIDLLKAGGNGYTICSKLQQNPKYQSIPIVFITPQSSDEETVKGIDAGAVDFILKPLKKELFLLRIKSVISQHKQVSKYNSLFRQMGEGSCLLEPIFNKKKQIVDTRHLDFNDAYSKLIPFTKKDLLDKTWLELMPDTDSSWFESMQDTLLSDEKSTFVKYIKALDRWVSVKVYSVSKNSFALILCDITEQKKLEVSLRESNDKYKLLFTNLNASFSVHKIITDENNVPTNYQFVEVNDKVEERFGLSKQEMLGKNITEIFPNIEHKWIQRFGEVGLNGKPMHLIDYSLAFGRYYEVHLYCPMKGYCASIFTDVTEQINQKQALKDSEEKYKEIAENIGDWVWKSDLGLHFTYASPGVVKIRGLSIAEVLNDPIENTFTTESITRIKTVLNKKLELIKQDNPSGWEPIKIELQIYKNDKSLIWIQTTARFLKGEDGLPNEIIGSARDINEQKQAKVALEESEKKYRSLFENSNDPVTLIQEHSFVECNEATLKIFGYKNKQEFIQLKPWHISPKHQPDGQLSKAKGLEIIHIVKKEGRHSFEWLHKHRDGTPIWFYISIAQVTLKGSVFFYTVYRDITRRKKAELALIKSEEKYRLIADNISDLVWKTDMDLNFTYVSPSIITLRGFTQREAFNQNFNEILSPDSISKVKKHFLIKLNQVKKGKPEGWNNEVLDLKLKHKNNSYIWAQISARFIKPEKGLPVEIIGVTRDVTKQKMAEMALSKSQEELIQTNTDKDKFISILAHDLIGSIGGSIQVIEMLELKGMGWDKRETFINYLFDNTKSAYDLLVNMVAWGKASLGKNMFKPAPMNLFKLTQDINHLYHAQLQQKNIDLNIDINSEQMVYADEHMLEAIYRNLLRNSIKFSNSGGSIELKIKSLADNFELSVEDNGIGMESEKAEQLFTVEHIDSEEGTKGEKGTGIGLQIAKEYITQHSGKIWAESTPHIGTTIKFTLPKQKF